MDKSLVLYQNSFKCPFAFPESCNIIERIFMVMIKSSRILKSPCKDLWKDPIVMPRMFQRDFFKGFTEDLLRSLCTMNARFWPSLFSSAQCKPHARVYLLFCEPSCPQTWSPFCTCGVNGLIELCRFSHFSCEISAGLTQETSATDSIT